MQRRPRLWLEHHAITDIGLRRKHNEDSVLGDAELGLFVVADGMGGHLAGEVASRQVVDTMRAHIQLARSPLGCPMPDPDPSLSATANCLRAAILEANAMVKAMASQNEAWQGMGSTVAAIYLENNILVAANVGDSPIFLLRDGVLRQLSTPHTVAAEHAAQGKKLTPHMATLFGHMLTRAVGTRDHVIPDIFETIPRPGDALLLCSDGLSEKATREEILDALLEQSPHGACRTLVDLALERGGEDNITALVLRFHARQDEEDAPLGSDGPG